MAQPGNPDPRDPRLTDPLDPARPVGTGDPVVDNRPAAQPRGMGSGWLIALIVLVLAIVAYYVFSSGTTPETADVPATTQSAPADGGTPAPADGGTMAPAEPDAATPPADNTAPANPPADSGTTEPATPPADGGTTEPATPPADGGTTPAPGE